MFTVALTGGIGCGKTTICELFSQLNVPVIDTDIIAHQLVEPGQPALQEILSKFGTDLLLENNSLNRKALANIIFNNKEKRQQLEEILHPKIRQCINEKLTELESPYAVVAIPLLIETSQQSQYDRVLVVDCDEQQQIERTLARDKRSKEEVQSIVKSQISRKQRLSFADDIIDNSFDTINLQYQVKKLHKLYLKLANDTNHSLI